MRLSLVVLWIGSTLLLYPFASKQALRIYFTYPAEPWCLCCCCFVFFTHLSRQYLCVNQKQPVWYHLVQSSLQHLSESSKENDSSLNHSICRKPVWHAKCVCSRAAILFIYFFCKSELLNRGVRAEPDPNDGAEMLSVLDVWKEPTKYTKLL